MAKTDDLVTTSNEVQLERSAGPEKDASVRAWLQVAGAFCLYFNTWGEAFCCDSKISADAGI